MPIVVQEQYGELHTLTTFDGKRTVFAPNDKDIQLLVYGAYGAPPTNFVTRRGYRQDGETEQYFTLGARQITIELHVSPRCSRQDYWNIRAQLHDFFRPNRNGPMTLTLRTPGSIKRALVVRATPGLIFAPSPPNENSWEIVETISLTAFNPVWFDPTVISLGSVGSTNNNLVFPITFPIQWGGGQFVYPMTVNYAGSWRAYPTITLTGPFTSAQITNLSTGISIYLFASVVAGQQRIITTTPGSLNIVDQNGVRHFTDFGILTDLVDFNLKPDPEVAGGVNSLLCTFFGAQLGTTQFQLSYNNQYFAL